MDNRAAIQKRSQMDMLWDFCCFITVLCSLGFPGNLERLFPGGMNLVFQYGPFMLQIVLMLLSSGEDVMDIKLFEFKRCYLPIYTMLVVWFAVSMSITRYPKEQFIACTRFTVTALFALWMVEKYTIEHILEICYYACLAMLFFTLVGLVLLPGASFSRENGEKTFCGLYTTKNPCASELAIGLMIGTMLHGAYKGRRRRFPKFFILYMAMHMALLLLCKATGALFCALIPISYLLFLRRHHNPKLRLHLGVVYIAASVGFLVFALTIIPLFAPLFEALGKDVTLTGRTPMWEQLITVMTEHNSFTGFGFTMFWKDPLAVKLFHNGFRRGSWGAAMTYGAHNALLEIWLDVGLIGVAAYFGMLMLSFHRPEQLTEIQYEFCSSYILWQTLKGFTERSYIPFNYQTLFLFLCAGISCSRYGAQKPSRLRRYQPVSPPPKERAAGNLTEGA